MSHDKLETKCFAVKINQKCFCGVLVFLRDSYRRVGLK